MSHTWPVEVRARDDWLPAQTLRMNIPWSASTTLGLYTRLVSPWPSFPADKQQPRCNSLPLIFIFTYTPQQLHKQKLQDVYKVEKITQAHLDAAGGKVL